MIGKNFVLAKELEKRKLPDLLTAQNGEKVTTVERWESEMRPYWKNIILEHCYGKTPVYVQPKIQTKINEIDFAGKAVWETVSFTFAVNGKEHTVPTQLIYPVGAKNVPFFVYLNFRPDIPDRYLPVEEIIDNGFGIFSVCYNDVTTDNGDFTNGLAGLFEDETRAPNATGKIRYWSYMASRMMDYLQTREEADKSAIGVAGHSRLGKTALLTGALDERFAFVCTNDSGCSGAALTRGRCEGGEPVEVICRVFPYWFCPTYHTYVGREDEMPFDHHALVALVAPRAVYIGGAIEDVWADNDNQFLAGVAASEIWEMYGKVGMVSPDRLPVEGDTWTDGNVGFHLRKGKHYHSRTDWLIYMDAVKKLLKK